MINKEFIVGPHGMKYLSLGELKYHSTCAATDTKDYRRQLDLNTAIATTTFKSGGKKYVREVLASLTEKVIEAIQIYGFVDERLCEPLDRKTV